jgi:AraC-like DNA-binding protein
VSCSLQVGELRMLEVASPADVQAPPSEAHLRDPHLNPTTVARACKITARYLHHLFSTESETVTQYIQRRRLEECARALIAAPVRGRLVTDIAFDYGFNSLTHFGRVFRHQFGLTPSEYRRGGAAR